MSIKTHFSIEEKRPFSSINSKWHRKRYQFGNETDVLTRTVGFLRQFNGLLSFHITVNTRYFCTCRLSSNSKRNKEPNSFDYLNCVLFISNWTGRRAFSCLISMQSILNIVCVDFVLSIWQPTLKRVQLKWNSLHISNLFQFTSPT